MEVRSFFRSVVVRTTKRDWSTHLTPLSHAVVMPDESRPANECEGSRPWAHAATDRMVGHTTDRYTDGIPVFRTSVDRTTSRRGNSSTTHARDDARWWRRSESP